MKLTNKVRNISNNAAKLHNDRMFSPHSRFLEGGPTFITYYKNSTEESTSSMGTNTVYAEIGKNSPFRRRKINGMVVYKFMQLTHSLQYTEETGYEANIDSTCLFLPETVIPVAGDMFTVEYMSDVLIFRVDDAQPGIVDSNSYIEVSYSLYRSDKESLAELEETVVATDELIFDNIGTEFKSVISTEDYNNAYDLEQLYKRLLGYYKDEFYLNHINCIVDTHSETRLYNKYLVEFFKRHKLFEEADYMIILTEEVEKEKNFRRVYDNSIYGVIKSRNYKDLKYNHCVLSTNTYYNFSILNTYKKKYYSMELTELFKDTGVDISMDTIPKELYNAIISEPIDPEFSLDTDISINSIIYSFIKNKDYVIGRKEIEYLRDIYLDENNYMYSLFPLILYIVRYSFNFYINYKHNIKNMLNQGGIDNVKIR